MKRTVAVIMILLILLFTACSGTNLYFKTKATVLSEWLTANGFDETLSQTTFFHDLGMKLQYEGKPIAKQIGGIYIDGIYGGGFSGHGKFFGFSDDWVRSEDGTYADYYVSFYTDIAIDQLGFPLQLSIGDSFSQVANALGVDDPAPNSTQGLLDADNSKVIARSGNASLTVQDYSDAENQNQDYPLRLIFSETYQAQRSNGVIETVERTVTFLFDGEQKQFRRMLIAIHTNYPID